MSILAQQSANKQSNAAHCRYCYASPLINKCLSVFSQMISSVIFGRTVVYRSHYKRPQFPPKVDFGGPNNRLQASHVATHVDWHSRTLLTV